MSLRTASLIALAALGWFATARAGTPGYNLTILGHRFVPSEITVPANQKVELVVKNADATAEEFESNDMHREKVVPGGGELHIWIGPLSPGRYGFFGDFHPATAQGTVIVR